MLDEDLLCFLIQIQIAFRKTDRFDIQLTLVHFKVSLGVMKNNSLKRRQWPPNGTMLVPGCAEPYNAIGACLGTTIRIEKQSAGPKKVYDILCHGFSSYVKQSHLGKLWPSVSNQHGTEERWNGFHDSNITIYQPLFQVRSQLSNIGVRHDQNRSSAKCSPAFVETGNE